MKFRKLWTEHVSLIQDDDLLQIMIERYGLRRWTKIAEMLQSTYALARTPKQCRDRWFNTLKFKGNDRAFTKHEFKAVCDLFDEIGPQWSKISKLLGTKTENQIKNFMNATVRRNIRRFNHGKQEVLKIKTTSLGLLRISELREILLARKSCGKKWFADKELGFETYRKIEEVANGGKNESGVNESEIKEDLGRKVEVEENFVENEFDSEAFNEWFRQGMEMLSQEWMNGGLWWIY